MNQKLYYTKYSDRPNIRFGQTVRPNFYCAVRPKWQNFFLQNTELFSQQPFIFLFCLMTHIIQSYLKPAWSIKIKRKWLSTWSTILSCFSTTCFLQSRPVMKIQLPISLFFWLKCYLSSCYSSCSKGFLRAWTGSLITPL